MRELADYEIRTVVEIGWAGKKNRVTAAPESGRLYVVI
jgi:hypothetical protein